MQKMNEATIKAILQDHFMKDIGEIVSQDVERMDGTDICYTDGDNTHVYDSESVTLDSILNLSLDDDYEEDDENVSGTMVVETLVYGEDSNIGVVPLSMIYNYTITFDDFRKADGLYMEWVD